jgi:hypothetical protein
MQSKSSGKEGVEALLGVVLEVANMHGSTVSIDDLVQLLPGGTTAEDLRSALETAPTLSNEYALKDGFLVKSERADDAIAFKESRLNATNTNLRAASWMASKFRPAEFVIMAVSGSTSYKAASQDDDVDLFCVTNQHGMWTFLAKALVLARMSKLFKRSRAPICLSCVMDQRYANQLFNRDRGALFARDALVAHVIGGNKEYQSLLVRSQWMSRYFPRLHSLRSGGAEPEPVAGRQVPFRVVLANQFLYVVLGSYIKAKVRFHNRLLARQAKGLSIFKARIGPDHLIYESAKYLALREIYDDIQPAPQRINEEAPVTMADESSPHASGVS